jgi:hypothetical protein
MEDIDLRGAGGLLGSIISSFGVMTEPMGNDILAVVRIGLVGPFISWFEGELNALLVAQR